MIYTYGQAVSPHNLALNEIGFTPGLVLSARGVQNQSLEFIFSADLKQLESLFKT
jgi:hypothetical protein